MWLSKFQEAYESIVNEKNIFNKNSVYHVTSIKNIEIIKKEGLKINQARFFTTDSDEDWVRNAYKCNPIFLATKPNLYKGKDTIELIVDVSGLQIGADLGSLIDKGAILTERGLYFDYNFIICFYYNFIIFFHIFILYIIIILKHIYWYIRNCFRY